MDVVYLVRPGDRNDELRHSLRSLVNLPVARVWMVGHRPSWVRDVEHIAGNRHGEVKARNVYDNLLLACSHPDMPERFVVMNDDFYILAPAEPLDIAARWRRSLADHIAGVPVSEWRSGLVAAQRWLRSQGVKEPLSYELHIPVTVDRGRLLKVLEEASPVRGVPPQWRTLYGNTWPIAGMQMADVKVKRGMKALPTPFVSSSDRSWRLPLFDPLRARFSTPSRWEAA